MRPGTAGVVTACAIAIATPRANAQAHTGHEGHMAQMAAAPKEQPARVVEPPPAIDGIPLVDQNGRATTLREEVESGEPVLLNFIFTTCTTICPVMSAGMSQLLSNLAAEQGRVRVVSISIDPENDTVEALQAYATRYHAPPSWRFLRGTPAAIEAAQRAFGSYRGGKNNHEPGTFVRSAASEPWIALDGFSSAQRLEHAVMGHAVPSLRP